MQKTACTHIANLLSQLFDGRMIGKHNAATKEQLRTTPYFIASIRNPWDWYLSLWTFGLQGRGALRHRLTNKDLYTTTSDDVGTFRRWLKSIHHFSNFHTLGEGYADTKLTKTCGLMTYRYLYLFCRHKKLLYKKTSCPKTLSELLKFDNKYCYINNFIRYESLASTLCSTLSYIKTLSNPEKALIFNAAKTNTSLRLLNIEDYYDQMSINLIQNREQLIINKFNYLPPK